MTNDSAESNEAELAHPRAAASHLHTEIDELRQRLAALEARAPEPANKTVAAKRRRRATPKRLALMIAGVMLAAATIVFGQSAVESLFVSKEGNVGIGTSTPRARLDVSGGGVKIGAPSDVTPAAGTELVLSPLSGTSAGITFQHNQVDTVFLKSDGSTRLTTLGANAGTFLAIDNRDGKVGIGTTPPSARLDVAGSGWFRNDQGGLPATAGKGVRVFYDANDSGQIFSYDYSTSKSKNLILQSPGGNVGIGTENTPQAKLDVAGNVRVAGTIVSQGRYQRDDAVETLYEVSPRYHISLTAAEYSGRTRQIPQQVIHSLCGDPDGCQFRLGMTRWSANTETETASLTGIMYYSKNDGRWRTSMLAQWGKEAKSGEAAGIDGNKKAEHVANAWDTCYFTDGPYSGSQDQGDAAIGMYLLVWTGGYTNPGRTCELTLID
jgi:hypothetical protein